MIGGNVSLYDPDPEDYDHPEGTFGDLWRYSPATNMWTWLSGSDSAGASGVYPEGLVGGNYGEDYTPGARGEGPAWQVAGKMYLFSGASGSWANDVWVYDTPPSDGGFQMEQSFSISVTDGTWFYASVYNYTLSTQESYLDANSNTSMTYTCVPGYWYTAHLYNYDTASWVGDMRAGRSIE